MLFSFGRACTNITHPFFKNLFMLEEIIAVYVHGLHGYVNGEDLGLLLAVLIEVHCKYVRLDSARVLYGGYAIPQFTATDRPISGEPFIIRAKVCLLTVGHSVDRVEFHYGRCCLVDGFRFHILYDSIEVGEVVLHKVPGKNGDLAREMFLGVRL